jgi:hypothetical protein
MEGADQPDTTPAWLVEMSYVSKEKAMEEE